MKGNIGGAHFATAKAGGAGVDGSTDGGSLGGAFFATSGAARGRELPLNTHPDTPCVSMAAAVLWQPK